MSRIERGRLQLSDLKLGVAKTGAEFYDNLVRAFLRISPEEAEILYERATEEEVIQFSNEFLSFSDKRKLINRWRELFVC